MSRNVALWGEIPADALSASYLPTAGFDHSTPNLPRPAGS